MAKQYEIPLRLVSPHMKGDKVKDAQWLMAGNNRFADLAPYKDGKLDGDYGPLTAQATRRTKYWLGYPENGLDQVFGQTLYEYLLPRDSGKWRPLPEAYQERRAQRLKYLEATSNPGARALALAEKEIGYHESPAGSNNNKYGIEYGFNRVAWCIIFMSIMFKHSGTPRFHYASVEAVYWDARANRNGLYIVRTPRPGDFIGYIFHGERFVHGAFFHHKVDSNTLVDLAGNTSATNFANGGEVAKQNRETSLVDFYARVS